MLTGRTRRRRTHAWVAAATLVASSGAPIATGEQQPPFRAGAELVRVDVTVLDGRGLPVTDLTAGDFIVDEDGVRQSIQTFRLVEATGVPAPGDVTSLPIRSQDHARAEAGRDEVRVFLIFWDDYHVNEQVGPRSAANQLHRFVRDAFAPLDLVALMNPLTPADAIVYTRDRAALAQGVRALTGRSGLLAPRAMAEEAHLSRPSQVTRLRAQVSLSALRSAVAHLAALREGRKTLIVISNGIPVEPKDLGAALELVQAASDGNVAVYFVNPMGLPTGGDDGVWGGNGSAAGARMLLDDLARASGGEAFLTNDLDKSFRRAVVQASAFYLIGYAPPSKDADRRFRKIKVRVTRSGLHVRARSGYWSDGR